MKTEIATKGVIGLFTGVMSYLYSSISELIIVLGIFILIDYVSGLIVALKKGTFDSKKGAWGAITKVCYVVVVAMCFLLDFTIIYLAKNSGIELPLKAVFGIVITIIFIGNEGFSGLRNFILLGVPVPAILLKAFGLIKNEAGKIIRLPKENQKEGDKVNVQN